MEDKEVITKFLGGISNENTLRSYEYTLNLFLNYAKDNKLSVVSGDRAGLRGCIRDFLWEQGWKRRTANYRLAAIKSFYRWLVRGEALRADDPADLLEPPDEEEPFTEIPYPTSDLADRLLEHIGKQSDRWAIRDYALVLLLREAGLRSQELLSLELTDIRLDESKSMVVVRRGKGGKPRYVAIPRVTARLVTQVYVPAYLVKRVLFPSTHDPKKPITRQTVWNILTARGKGAGFSKDEIVSCRSPHAWRHLWTTEQIEKGRHPSIIQAMGGWTTDRMIQRYMLQEQLAEISMED